MTEQNLDILDQLMCVGYVQKTVGLLENTVTVTLRTLPTEQQLAVEASMRDVEGTPLFTVHTYSIRLLSRGLVDITYKGEKTVFTDHTQAEEYIKSKPAVFVDTLVAEHGKLEKEMVDLISDKGSTENFSKTPLVASEPN